MIERLLTLDQSSRTGWAVGNIGERPQWGVAKFSGSNGEVGLSFMTWLSRLLAAERPDILCFETPFVPRGRQKFVRAGTAVSLSPNIPMNALTLRRLMGFAFCIEAICCEYDVRCREVTTLEVTRFLLGRVPKRAEKKIATVNMIRAYGFDVQDDNEADAMAIWLCAEATIAPQLAQRRGEGPLFLRRAV